MSKFTDLVTANYTGRMLPNHPNPAKLVGWSTKTAVSGPDEFTYDKEYTISLNFYRTTRADCRTHEGAVLPEAIRQFKNELKYLIYSDLAPLVHNLREYVYRADDPELSEALSMLLDEVAGPA